MELARIDRAGSDLERRELQAQLEAEQARKADHLARARELWGQAPKLAGEVDAKFAEAMACLKRYDDCVLEMGREAQAGGGHATIPVKSAVLAAFVLAVDGARLPRGMIITEPPAPKARALVDSLPASQGFE